MYALFYYSLTEEARQECVKKDLIKPLVKLINENDNLVVHQACRAIGNMCYDNGQLVNCITRVMQIKLFYIIA